jgi:hypothetical protein
MPYSYHDLHITTEHIPRTPIFNLPFSLMVTCTRTGGWELWNVSEGIAKAKLVAGEYSELWMVLDVDGTVIVDSRKQKEPDLAPPSPPG